VSLTNPWLTSLRFGGVLKLTCYGQLLRAYELPSAAAPTATPTCIAYAHLQPRGQLGLHHFGHGHLDSDSACRLDFANLQHRRCPQSALGCICTQAAFLHTSLGSLDFIVIGHGISLTLGSDVHARTDIMNLRAWTSTTTTTGFEYTPIVS
jgi:hypothetical protein